LVLFTFPIEFICRLQGTGKICSEQGVEFSYATTKAT